MESLEKAEEIKNLQNSIAWSKAHINRLKKEAKINKMTQNE